MFSVLKKHQGGKLQTFSGGKTQKIAKNCVDSSFYPNQAS